MSIDRGVAQLGAAIQATDPTLVGRSSDGCSGTLAGTDEISGTHKVGAFREVLA